MATSEFPLLRRFSVLSALILSALVVVLATFQGHLARENLVAMSENNNIALSHAFSNSIWPEFSAFLSGAGELSSEALRQHQQTARLRRDILLLMRGINVVKVKIYDVDGLTVFSTQEDQIGEDKSSNSGFKAARAGQVASELTHRDTFSAFEQIIEDRDVLSSYIPIQSVPDGRIEGVFEIYADITPLVARIDETRTRVLIVVAATLLALYLALFLFMRRAHHIIRRQHQELHEQNRQLQTEVGARELAEKKIREHNENLEQLIDERTADLLQAKKMADAANHAKSAFLANMSHELRTPLNGVIGLSEALHDSGLSERQGALLDTINASGKQLLSVIDGILDLSKIEAGKTELVNNPFDLRVLIEDVTTLFIHAARRKGLELVHCIHPQLHAWYDGDGDHLRQILINLIGNAIKFTNQGQVIIAVSEVGDGSRSLIRVEVSDTGTGIAPEQQAHVFDAFTQADASAARSYGGSGLGLRISKLLVELMGGQISVQSAPHRGSRFQVMLPLARVQPQYPEPDVALQRTRILVFEQHDATRTHLCDQVEAAGAEAIQARTENDVAIWISQAARCAAVDCMLVNLSSAAGRRAVASARAHAPADTLPIVGMYWATDSAKTVDQANVTARITKPVRRNDLYAALAATGRGVQRKTDHAARARSSQDSDLAGTRVLLVEDDVVNQKVALALLKGTRAQVDVVENGHEAVIAVREGDYDVVLMDCQMPEMDGYQATRTIREWEARQGRPHIPIVALTALAMRGDREKCLAAGMDGYLTKPFSRAQLQAALSHWVPADRPQRAAAASTPGG